MKNLNFVIATLFFLCLSFVTSPVYSSLSHFGHMKINEDTLLKATFKQQRFLQGITRPILSNGEMLLLGNKGIIWETKNPFSNRMLITHRGVYRIVNKKPRIVSKTGNNVIMSLISKILNGSLTDGVKAFNVNILSRPNAKRWKIELTPKDKKMQSFVNNIKIEGVKFVQSIVIQHANGGKDIITMENHAIYVGEERDKILSPEQERWLNG